MVAQLRKGHCVFGKGTKKTHEIVYNLILTAHIKRSCRDKDYRTQTTEKIELWGVFKIVTLKVKLPILIIYEDTDTSCWSIDVVWISGSIPTATEWNRLPD